jgi:environmental stress-induced protein Ves
MIVQRAESRPPQPWRNGRGVQYEIAANGPVDGGWTWRLSTADISEDVPFSVFPGVVRHFCVADGNGVILTIDGVPTTCALGSVTRFMGDSEVHARLIDGPMRALNLMTMNDDSVSLKVLGGGSMSHSALAVVAIGGEAEVEVLRQSANLRVLDAVLDLSHSSVVIHRGEVAVLEGS